MDKLIIILLTLFILGIEIYGIVLSFSASIILGIVSLFIQPAPFVYGLLGLFGKPEVCEIITRWLNLPT